MSASLVSDGDVFNVLIKGEGSTENDSLILRCQITKFHTVDKSYSSTNWCLCRAGSNDQHPSFIRIQEDEM